MPTLKTTMAFQYMEQSTLNVDNMSSLKRGIIHSGTPYRKDA